MAIYKCGGSSHADAKRVVDRGRRRRQVGRPDEATNARGVDRPVGERGGSGTGVARHTARRHGFAAENHPPGIGTSARSNAPTSRRASIYAANYMTFDTLNTAYVNPEYAHAFTDVWSIQLGLPYTDQRDVGSALLGDFSIWNVGARVRGRHVQLERHDVQGRRIPAAQPAALLRPGPGRAGSCDGRPAARPPRRRPRHHLEVAMGQGPAAARRVLQEFRLIVSGGDRA